MNANERILDLFISLLKKEQLIKTELMEKYDKSASSIQRDINTIKRVLETFRHDCLETSIILNESKGAYSINRNALFQAGLSNIMRLSETELMAIMAILISSRAFTKEEVEHFCSILVQDKSHKNMFKNALMFYKSISPQSIFNRLDIIIQALSKGKFISFDYTKNFKTCHFTRKPVAFYFSDLYFYVATDYHESEDDIVLENLNKFRIHNMENLKIVDDLHAPIDYIKRFQYGELSQLTGPFSFYGKPIDVTIDFFL